ncbi:GNAT family N-acetyltransferase, partial [Yersinia enterocolitica]
MFINKKLLFFLIIISPFAFTNEIKSKKVYLYPEDKYQSEIETSHDTEYIEHGRFERDTAGTLGCVFIPGLAIYNYVTQSRCDQVDKLWGQISHWFSGDNKKKAILIVGNTALLKPQPELPIHKNNQAAPLTLTLNKINTQLHSQALTLPAT